MYTDSKGHSHAYEIFRKSLLGTYNNMDISL